MKVWRGNGREFPFHNDGALVVAGWWVSAAAMRALGYELVDVDLEMVAAKQEAEVQGGTSQAIVERFAAYAHERWARWMIHIFGKSSNDGAGNMVVPKEWANRWAQQARTLYSGLSEDEKESDRVEALGWLSLVEQSNPYDPPKEPEGFELVGSADDRGYPALFDDRITEGKRYRVVEVVE